MPFVLPFLPAIIGAGASVGGALIGKSGSSSSQKLTDEQLQLAQQDQALAQHQEDFKEGLVNSNQPFLSSLNGGSDVTQTPFYKSLVKQGISSTANAYQNAQSNLLQKANSSGFGYQQPIVQGANAGLQSEEAKAMANVPVSATINATQAGLQASGIQAGEAGGFNPGASQAAAVGATSAANASQAQTNAGNQSFYAGLLKAGNTLLQPILQKYGSGTKSNDDSQDDIAV